MTMETECPRCGHHDTDHTDYQRHQKLRKAAHAAIDSIFSRIHYDETGSSVGKLVFGQSRGHVRFPATPDPEGPTHVAPDGAFSMHIKFMPPGVNEPKTAYEMQLEQKLRESEELAELERKGRASTDIPEGFTERMAYFHELQRKLKEIQEVLFPDLATDMAKFKPADRFPHFDPSRYNAKE